MGGGGAAPGSIGCTEFSVVIRLVSYGRPTSVYILQIVEPESDQVIRDLM